MIRYAYTSSQGFAGVPGMLPFVTATFLRTNAFQHIAARLTLPALVDSGATVNVLPFDIGERLGFVWDETHHDPPLVGTISGAPALGVKLFVKVGDLVPVQLAFGWSEIPSTRLPCILGQTNFFDEFYVDFRKPHGYFDIFLKNDAA